MPTEISLSVRVKRRGSGGAPGVGAFEANIEIPSVEGGGVLDENLFIFKRGVSSTTEDADSFFVGVASIHQVSTFGTTEPDDMESQSSPYWRSDSTGYLSFSTIKERERFVSLILETLSTLGQSAEEMILDETSEDYVISGGGISSEEETGED